MKVLLLNPLTPSREMEFCDMGLGYLAAALRDSGHQPLLMLRALDKAAFHDLLRRERPDIIGIKILSSNVNDAIATVAAAREASDAAIVIGGPHVSGDPERVLDYVPADYAVQGEGDRALPALATALEAGNGASLAGVAGLIRREEGKTHANAPDLITDLDALSFPAWDLMPPGQYQSLVCRRPPAASVMTARGCTNRCKFCSEACSKLRHRSIDSVMDEITYLVGRFGVREIQFLDSNFIARRDYIMSLCERVLESGLNLAFCAPNGSRLEIVDDEVCAMLARIGFYRVNVGIESGSPEILRRVGKGSDLSRVVEKIATLRRHKIQVVGNFMVGFPDETRADLQKTLDLILSLDLTGMNIAIYTPMPGTKLYDELVETGRLARNPDFRNYEFVSYRNELTELSPEELKHFRDRCVSRFLLRPRTLKTVIELARSGISWRSLAGRLYWMYLAKYLRDRRRGGA